MRFLLILVLLFTGCNCPEPPAPAPAPGISWTEVKFTDGDTFFYGGEIVRLLGCDTPEMASPHHHGDQEPWATKAYEMASRLTREAKHLEIKFAANNDKYGRRLAHLILDGRPLACYLIEAGLAFETVSHFGHNGFPEYTDMILKSKGPKPEFQEPYKWRRAHR